MTPFGFVRETLFGRPGIAGLHWEADDGLPLIRTIWAQTFADDRSRERFFAWMCERSDRWSAWGDLARGHGASSLTSHLSALVALDGSLAGDVD